MEDLDFFDMLYQGFTKTTHAEDAYWGFEKDPDVLEDERGYGYRLFYVTAENPEEKRHLGWLDNEEDAAFITAVHGCFPDLHRALLHWHDEAETKDRERDDTEVKYAELVEEFEKLRGKLVAAQRGQQRRDVEDYHGKATES